MKKFGWSVAAAVAGRLSCPGTISRLVVVSPVAFAFLALALASGPATASTVTYSVSGSFANGATFLAGSILTIDTTAGTVSNSDLLVSAGNNPSPANTFTDANLIQNGSFQTPFDWGLADGTDLTMFNGATEFQGFSPSGRNRWTGDLFRALGV
jgi:hypothetical protein